jgi:DUF917 family protein
VVGVALERGFRRYCAWKGGWIYFAFTLGHGCLQRALVRGSLRLALDLGRAAERARASGDEPVAALVRVAGGARLFCGRIVDVVSSAVE